MPQIFKALATITAWALFIFAWVTGLSAFLGGITSGALYGGKPPSMVIPVFFLVALAEGVSAVVVMILRKKME
jgi:hypothetical protein